LTLTDIANLSFALFVGGREQFQAVVEAGTLAVEVNDQVEFGRLGNRNLSRLHPFQDPIWYARYLIGPPLGFPPHFFDQTCYRRLLGVNALP
jgi:hypothetical protein